MHELGIVFHIAKQIEEIARENNVKRVNKVVLEIGEVSTVIGSYLTDCWRWNAERNELLAGSELVIETIPGVTYCNGCEQRYPTVQYGRICPYCGSEDTFLIQGNETEIKEIEVE
jgi:hydrogenase nickel incorporation protein HypA/HybF